MSNVKTTFWDPAEYLETDEDIEAYLKDIFSSNDPKLNIVAIDDVMRAQCMNNK